MNKCTFYTQCNEPIARCCINHYQECEAYKRFEMAEQRRERFVIPHSQQVSSIKNSPTCHSSGLSVLVGCREARS